MPITSITSDADDLTVTVVGDYPVSVERLWQAYADPRQLERFWGPEQWPATFTRHDMAVGGRSHYHMTGPDGAVSAGWWQFRAIEPGRRLEVDNGFAEDTRGTPNPRLPSMRITVTFEATPGGSRFRSVIRYPSVEAMEQVLAMGMMEGMRSAMGQLDQVLADLRSFAFDRPTEAQLLGDTQVRVSRVIRGSSEDVWRAHHEPDLMKRWLTGPDGWTMPVCEIATEVGGTYRFEWEAADGSGRFGFEGELIEMEAPFRAVTTERMIGTEGPATVNEMTLVPVDGGTLLSIVITYPSSEVRDMILGTGMVDGMETSYDRLERDVLSARAA